MYSYITVQKIKGTVHFSLNRAHRTGDSLLGLDVVGILGAFHRFSDSGKLVRPALQQLGGFGVVNADVVDGILGVGRKDTSVLQGPSGRAEWRVWNDDDGFLSGGASGTRNGLLIVDVHLLGSQLGLLQFQVRGRRIGGEAEVTSFPIRCEAPRLDHLSEIQKHTCARGASPSNVGDHCAAEERTRLRIRLR